MLARPARRATYHRALRSGELIPQNEWDLRRSAGSGMLKGDPLTRGAMLALPITSSLAVVTRMTEDPGGSAETSDVQTISKAVRVSF